MLRIERRTKKVQTPAARMTWVIHALQYYQHLESHMKPSRLFLGHRVCVLDWSPHHVEENRTIATMECSWSLNFPLANQWAPSVPKLLKTVIKSKTTDVLLPLYLMWVRCRHAYFMFLSGYYWYYTRKAELWLIMDLDTKVKGSPWNDIYIESLTDNDD